jgi:hypothetical protein
MAVVLRAQEGDVVHDFLDVLEKNAPRSGRRSRLPQRGQTAPLACSLMDWVTETSFWQLSQKYS